MLYSAVASLSHLPGDGHFWIHHSSASQTESRCEGYSTAINASTPDHDGWMEIAVMQLTRKSVNDSTSSRGTEQSRRHVLGLRIAATARPPG